MTPERWHQVKQLFQSVVECEASQRAAFLDQACAGDPDLRRELETLLASDEQAANFLEAPAAKLRIDQQAESMGGRYIGPYQIVREIARGGMGAVYLAERADDQFQKHVAIKIVKRGMDSDAILRRFRNEQKILANLDHPNIARLIDGGTTEDGLSYFIMDYVEGLPIDAYCDTHPLSTLERLKLFRTVCSAVEYAHQHRVIHRDLKPGNILVTDDGVPRLLDFGIAKVLSPDEFSQTTGLTGALRLMTPRYASPEQVRGEPVTPASDVYSLGVVLFELLTGHHPFRLRSHTPQEIERVIREEEPEKPSAAIRRVAEVPGTDGLTRITLTPESVSKTRERQPEKLRRRLTGDLDNIVLMALRKEPLRRYPSAGQLSEDIHRHLEGRPVLARSDTLAYRSTKFIKRNTAAVIALLVAMIVVALINAGLYLLPRRDRVNDAAINSIAVLPLKNISDDPEQEYFADSMTQALITDLEKIGSLRVISRTSVMRYKEARKPLSEIARELKVDGVVEGSVVGSDGRVRITAQLIETATEQLLGSKSYERELRDILVLQTEVARAIAQEIKIKLTPQEEARLATAGPVYPEAYQLYLKGRFYGFKTSKVGLKRSIEHYQQAIRIDPGFALAYAGLAQSYVLASDVLLTSQEAKLRGEEAAMKALALDNTLAEAHVMVAFLRGQHDWDWAGAETGYKRAIELNPGSAGAHGWYGMHLGMIGRLDESVAELKRALELDPLSIDVNLNLGRVFYFRRQYEQAIEQLLKTRDMDQNFFLARLYLGLAYEQAGIYEEAIAEFRRLAATDFPDTRLFLAHALAVSGKRAQALKALDEATEFAKAGKLRPWSMAALYAALGDKDEAFAWLQKACDERFIILASVKVDPVFDPLRSDPRFRNLLGRLGLPP